MKGAAAVALAFALATACTTSGDATADARRFLDHYVATLESRDVAQVRDLFVDDGRFLWFTDGAKSYGSAAEVLAGLTRAAWSPTPSPCRRAALAVPRLGSHRRASTARNHDPS